MPDRSEVGVSFADLVDVTPTVGSSFTAKCLPGRDERIYGGDLLAHLLIAAARSAHPGSAVHSLHANFLSPGRPGEAVAYGLEVLKTSKRFSSVRVDASQGNERLASATVSFHSAETSAEHSIPRPEKLMDPTRSDDAHGGPIPPPDAPIRTPFDLRFAREAGEPTFRETRPVLSYWVRLRDDTIAMPAHHAAALLWASDFSLTRVADFEYESTGGNRQAASLDHAIWFHRPVRANRWHLYEVESPVYTNALALSSGRFFDKQGHLVATVAQESLLRRNRSDLED